MLENILSVVTGKRIVSACEAKLTDIDLFASFTIRIDDSANLWEVKMRKYGDQQLDRSTSASAEKTDTNRAARVQALADAATFIQEYYRDNDDDDMGEEKPSIFDLVADQS